MEEEDKRWMRVALEEARKGVGRTAPNPPVGAVIVKGGRVLGKGWHRRAGGPHAEVEAMREVISRDGGDALVGATAYVTLEPCSTVGRTPACTDGLREAGVRRVVYGSVDPNPAHGGAADEVLKAGGVEVMGGVLMDECDEILRPFSKVQRTGLPWVIWKCAMSLDGKITRPVGEGQWLSGEESRAEVQRLRGEVDAVLTSGETVRRDRPLLNIRVPEYLEGRGQPWRVIVTDRPETLPMEAELFSEENARRNLLRGSADLEGMLSNLVREQGVLSVMMEAGGGFSAAMFAAGLVDEVVIYYAPILCGDTVPALKGMDFGSSIRIESADYQVFGKDLCVRGLVAR